jgi:hypothetical protein
MQGVKGKAVVAYAEPLTTQQMQHRRLSRRVRNVDVFPRSLDVTNSEFDQNPQKRAKTLNTLFLDSF